MLVQVACLLGIAELSQSIVYDWTVGLHAYLPRLSHTCTLYIFSKIYIAIFFTNDIVW